MGFRIVKEICLKRDKEAVRMDIMVREPEIETAAARSMKREICEETLPPPTKNGS